MPIGLGVDVNRLERRLHRLQLLVDVPVLEHELLAPRRFRVQTDENRHVVRAECNVLAFQLIEACLEAAKDCAHLEVANVPASVPFVPQITHFVHGSVRCACPTASAASRSVRGQDSCGARWCKRVLAMSADQGRQRLDVVASLRCQTNSAAPIAACFDAIVQAPQKVRHDWCCKIQADCRAG